MSQDRKEKTKMAYALDFKKELENIKLPCCTFHDEQPLEEKLAQCRVTSAENSTYAVMYRSVLRTLLARHGDSLLETVLSPDDIALIEKVFKAHPSDEEFDIKDWNFFAG
jgi:hypothetical protein